MASRWPMALVEDPDPEKDPLGAYTSKGRDLATQSTLSVVLGLFAFLAFCFLRPRWTGLYAARKKQKNAASQLPHLPDSFFGWIPVLYKITEEEVLASAGLDAFVFLAFFRMAIKFLAFVLFFSLTVIYPIHKNFGPDDLIPTDGNNNGTNGTNGTDSFLFQTDPFTLNFEEGGEKNTEPNGYLWIYVVFAYVFSAAAIYLMVKETERVIRVRQQYLGVQSSITDRTFRLSGIPAHLRTEEKIRETIENLQIGKVESVTLCKNWKELDDLIAERMNVLRKLEEAWTIHLGWTRSGRRLEPLQRPMSRHQDEEEEEVDEESALLEGDEDQSQVTEVARPRPMARIWFGFLGLQSRKIDAIDYYEEKLRRLDERIKDARKKEYPPTPLAFVTLDSIAACQMAAQAVIAPEPMTLMVNAAPAPADVVWTSTYLSRRTRMTWAWSITFVILLLTIVWWVILLPLAALLNLETIGPFLPGFKELLERHEVLQSLVRTTLPTAILSLMTVIVPYLYDWLSNLQGMTSQGDVEMSVISKNFFFTFFNLFVSFTLIGTASKAYSYEQIKKKWGDQLNDVGGLPRVLAESLKELGPFYMNLIILQALGMFPFRLLEFGSVFLYPIGLMGSKTPRDYAELVQPPIFSYGFYLPNTLFIFIICMTYSILPNSELIVLFGLIYFLMGAFIYKYQLLYAMDHRHFSTGRAWPMICNRVTVGLVVFQIAMVGQLAFRQAYFRSVALAPLLIGTIWFGFSYRRTYEPLMKFISLRSLHEAQDEAISLSGSRYEEEVHTGVRFGDEEDHTRFINPSLVTPLEDVWVSKSRAHRASFSGFNGGRAGRV